MDVKITVALLASFVSFMGLLISKELKVSEFRQAWIDKLRDHVSEVISKSSLLLQSWISITHTQMRPGLEAEFFEKNADLLREICFSVSKAKLSLNPDKDKRMITSLENINSIIKEPSKLGELSEAVIELEMVSHKTFKVEWDRVKVGEPFYRISKWLVGFLVLMLVIYTVL
ncbi:hypothetical protein [Psychromonas sp. KJ10-2]|uniref:hypothetical protein n=1 Tax=Psychromonas sp. KJ10-2 TaxID=3391822 RepID=UPI0039B57019